jgi:ligand-binding SRPBCC domain-containing protein
MSAARFSSELIIPAPRDEVFAFFADAANLERITPPWLRFRIVTPGSIDMKAGAIIDYRLRIHGVPARWRSEITVWEPPHRFVDEQRRGPYRQWIHTHVFDVVPGGTRMTDTVDYVAPLAFVTGGFVRRDIETIFGYRTKVLRNVFGMPA